MWSLRSPTWSLPRWRELKRHCLRSLASFPSGRTAMIEAREIGHQKRSPEGHLLSHLTQNPANTDAARIAVVAQCGWWRQITRT